MQSTSELDVLLKILSAPEGYATKNINTGRLSLP